MKWEEGEGSRDRPLGGDWGLVWNLVYIYKLVYQIMFVFFLLLLLVSHKLHQGASLWILHIKLYLFVFEIYFVNRL